GGKQSCRASAKPSLGDALFAQPVFVEVGDELAEFDVRQRRLADLFAEVNVLEHAVEHRKVVLFQLILRDVQAITDVDVQFVQQVSPARELGDEEAGVIFWVLGFEDIGTALQEEHPEDEILELRGVHLAAQDVSGG